MTIMRAVILSGGPAHDFPALSGRLAHLFAEVGVVSTITTDPEQVPGLLVGTDLLVINALRWQMEAERYAHLREAQAYSPSHDFRSAVTSFVSNRRRPHRYAHCIDLLRRLAGLGPIARRPMGLGHVLPPTARPESHSCAS